MADAENHTGQFLVLGPKIPKAPEGDVNILAAATPLSGWPSTQEPAYKYLFAVKITNTDWQNLSCEVRCSPAPVTSQADLTMAHFDDAMKGKPVASSGLTLYLKSDAASLVIFYLDEVGATFEHPQHLNDAEYVILRVSSEPDLIYRAKWLKQPGDRKAVSVILGGRQSPLAVTYGLRARMQSNSTDIVYADIDPKVENEGEGGGGVPLDNGEASVA